MFTKRLYDLVTCSLLGLVSFMLLKRLLVYILEAIIYFILYIRLLF